MRLEIEGKVYEVEVTDDGGGLHRVVVDGTVYEVRLPDERPRPGPAPAGGGSTEAAPAADRPAGAAGPGTVRAPLPGSVTKIEVSVGDTVRLDQTLMVLESMKMNVPVRSTRGGTVKKIHVKVGDSVQVGEPIAELAPGSDEGIG